MSLDPIRDIMPLVIESDGRRERAYDIYSLLLKERIVFLGTPIDAMVANIIIAQLLYLDREDEEKDVTLYVNSPGGSVTAGLAIYDTMQLIRPDVATVCIGLAASMGTVLLTGGAKGKRTALPNATVHLHQVMGGAEGQASDIEIQARETLRLQGHPPQHHPRADRSADGAHRARHRPRLLACMPRRPRNTALSTRCSRVRWPAPTAPPPTPPAASPKPPARSASGRPCRAAARPARPPSRPPAGSSR